MSPKTTGLSPGDIGFLGDGVFTSGSATGDQKREVKSINMRYVYIVSCYNDKVALIGIR